MPTYRIDIHTGYLSPRALAGCDAHVSLTLYGTEASTDELVLDGSSFLGDPVESVSLSLGELGDIRRLRVRHDNAGVSPAWFLDHIAVRNEATGQRWTFPCHRWLARHEDDGEIERTLDATGDRTSRQAR
jgi:hypothetical protein